MLNPAKRFFPTRNNESQTLAYSTEEYLSGKKTSSEQNMTAYDPCLIMFLENEQTNILYRYIEVLQSARDRNYSVIPYLLRIFSKQCADHFLMEEINLYRYIKILAYRCGQKERCDEFVSEMKNISISVLNTINQSSNLPVNDATVDDFITEFEQIGELLMERIKKEQSNIFPKYNNSRKVVDIY